MTRNVVVPQPKHKLFSGVLYSIAAGLFIWNVWQLHQMSQGYRELVYTLATEHPVLLQEGYATTGVQPTNVCRPLLPVTLWNRNPEDVPIPPRWHRRVV